MLTDRPQAVRPAASRGGADGVPGRRDRRREPGAGARSLTITRLVQCRDGEPGKSPVMPRRASSSRTRGGRRRRGRDPRVGRGVSSSGRRAASRGRDGCRPPDHLGVVPDGRAVARRVTVDRRHAPAVLAGAGGGRGPAAGAARSGALPRGPFRICGAHPGAGGGVAARIPRAACPPACPGFGMPVCPYVCLPVRPSVRLPARPPAGPSARPLVRSSARPMTHPRRRRTRIHPRQVKPSRTSVRSKAVTRGTR